MNVALDILRKNLLSFICLIVAILSLVAVYVWPLPGKFTELQTKVNERKREHDSLAALLTKDRHLPIVQANETVGPSLGQFPTESAIKRAEEVTAKLADEGKKVLDLASKYNEHKPLVPGVLPNPTSTLTVQFQEKYADEMDYPNPDPKIRNNTLPFRALKAGIPPTEQDIQNEGSRREALMQQEGSPLGQEGLQFQIQQMRATLPQEMRDEIARNSRMYMNPDAVDVYPGVMMNSQGGVGGVLTAAQIYYAQVGLWVQQDVFAALAEANKDSKSVVESPVKHLLKIEVLEEFGHPAVAGGAVTGFANLNSTGGLPIITPGNTSGGGGGGSSWMMGGGGAPTPEGGAPVPPKGPTARTPNQHYDVIPFRLVINVDATQIPKVLTELSRNRFITVTKCDIVAREATSEMLMGYYYGQVPVVQLSLECEMLLLKTWLTPLMPAVLTAAPAVPPA
jgi:hypothetical protein